MAQVFRCLSLHIKTIRSDSQARRTSNASAAACRIAIGTRSRPAARPTCPRDTTCTASGPDSPAGLGSRSRCTAAAEVTGLLHRSPGGHAFGRFGTRVFRDDAQGGEVGAVAQAGRTGSPGRQPSEAWPRGRRVPGGTVRGAASPMRYKDRVTRATPTAAVAKGVMNEIANRAAMRSNRMRNVLFQPPKVSQPCSHPCRASGKTPQPPSRSGDGFPLPSLRRCPRPRPVPAPDRRGCRWRDRRYRRSGAALTVADPPTLREPASQRPSGRAPDRNAFGEHREPLP